MYFVFQILYDVTRNMVMGYPLQAADARDYLLQSEPSRPQWAC